MAPALPVYSRQDIEQMYPGLFPTRINKDGKPALNLDNCSLYSLIQDQCTYDGNKCVCVPFKRVFARCLDNEFNSRREVVGYKLTPAHQSMSLRRGLSRRDPNKPVYRNVEITEWHDNDYTNEAKGADSELVEEFLRADRIFQKKVKEYYAKESGSTTDGSQATSGANQATSGGKGPNNDTQQNAGDGKST